MDKLNDWELAPQWMKITMIISKWIIAVMPFIMVSIMTIFHTFESTWDNWLVTCVYLLSLANIINMVDSK